jgi:hypothetical protein
MYCLYTALAFIVAIISYKLIFIAQFLNWLRLKTFTFNSTDDKESKSEAIGSAKRDTTAASNASENYTGLPSF